MTTDKMTKRQNDLLGSLFSLVCVYFRIQNNGQEEISLIFRPQKLQAGPGYRNG